MNGNLFIVSAPSGAGKTSLVSALLASHENISLSISHTTRSPRPGEEHGRHYNFVSQPVFLEMAKRGDFLESAEVYGNFYGTSQRWIEQELAQGRDILLEIDWQGAAQVRRLFPDCISIFILPPSLSALKQRLQNRKQDSAEVIARRLAAAQDDISHVAEFDYVIINGKLDVALEQLGAIIMAARLRCARQLASQRNLISRLHKPE